MRSNASRSRSDAIGWCRWMRCWTRKRGASFWTWSCAAPGFANGSVLALLAPGAAAVLGTDVVIVEIAELFRGALLFHEPLQPAPGRIGHLGSTALHGIKVLDQMIDV